jgi:transposase-like protein
MKGRACKCCEHRERAAIDLALARGVSTGAVSKRYGISTDSVYRHRRNHLPPQLRAKLIAGPDIDLDLDKLKETESQSLLAHLVALRHRLFASLDVAEECGDSNMVCRVTGQLHANLELTGKLAAFPEARQAVAAVLHQLETKAAENITTESDRPLFDAAPVPRETKQ